MKMKQWYVFEMNGFTEEEAQELFNKAFTKFEGSEEHSMGILRLTDKGVDNLKKHVFKQEELQMSNYKRETTRKQAQTVTTVHAKDPSNLQEKLKNMVEELEVKLERDKSKNNE